MFRGPLIKRLIRDGHEVIAICPSGAELKEVEKLGAKVYVVDFDGHSFSLFSAAAAIQKIRKIILSEKPIAVQSFTHKANIFSALALFGVKEPRKLVTITGLGTLFVQDDHRSNILRVVMLMSYRFFSKKIDYFVFQNPDDEKVFLNGKACHEKKTLRVNGSGIDIEEYPEPEASSKDRDRSKVEKLYGVSFSQKIVVLLVARATRSKGVEDFYQAARAINSYNDNYCFIHAGGLAPSSTDGLNREEISSLALYSGVNWLDAIPDIEVLQNAADIAVLTSRREGVPRSLIEAAALGKPIITYDVPGAREVVIDKISGLLVQPFSIAGLTSAILSLDINDSELSLSSRRLAVTKFNVDDQYKVMLEIYRGNPNEMSYM